MSEPAPGTVVICGGGVIGASVAYYLGRRGVRSVIVERDAVASGASGAAAGILTPPMPGSGVVEQISAAGFDLHAELAEHLPRESGVDYGYRVTPRILLSRERRDEFQARLLVERLRAEGIESRWLGPEGVRERTGWVDRARGGIEVAAPAQLDPYRFTLALVTAAEKMGSEIRSGGVEGLLASAGRARGVVVSGVELEADAVVFAAGPWSGAVGQWTGLPVPVEPLKGQIVKVRPRHPLSDFCIGHDGNYVITKDRGLVYLGTTEETAGFDVSVTEVARDEILAFGLGLSSALEDAEFVEQTACLRPLSADGLPIIGPIPGLSGAYIATGHGRQGILMAPPTGRAVADLVVEGRSPGLDIGPFGPGRFLPARS